MPSERDTLRERIKKQGPLEAIFELFKTAWERWLWPAIGMVAAPIWAGVVAVTTGILAWFSRLDPLTIWTLSLLGLGGGLWIANQLRSWVTDRRRAASSAAPVQATETDAEAKRKPAVEFWLPGKWETGFRLKNLGLDDNRHEVLAEEVSIRVVAKKRMQDVRLEIAILHRDRNQLETMARIGSDRFSGVVTPGLEQTFVVMRRTFSMITAVRKHLTQDNAEVHEQMRADREVIFFPENPARFLGKLGEIYSVHIAVHHDDGPPNEARLKLTLIEKRMAVATKMTSLDNITPITMD